MFSFWDLYRTLENLAPADPLSWLVEVRPPRQNDRLPPAPGHSDRHHAVDWSALPEELAELILSKLPLPTLARVSTTSRRLQAVFYDQRALQQKVCCDLAAEKFGHGRIINITVLVDRWLKGDTLDEYQLDYGIYARCWLEVDGTCTRCQARRWPMVGICKYEKEMYRSICAEGLDGMVLDMIAEPYFPGSRVHFEISRHGAVIILHVLSDQDVQGVALVLCLLCEGLARIFHDAGTEAQIDIRGWNMPTKLTPAGFKAMIGPLMPFITPHTVAESALVGVLKLPRSRCNLATGTPNNAERSRVPFHSP